MYHRKQNLSFDAPLYKLRFKRPEFDKRRHPNNGIGMGKNSKINKFYFNDEFEIIIQHLQILALRKNHSITNVALSLHR